MSSPGRTPGRERSVLKVRASPHDGKNVIAFLTSAVLEVAIASLSNGEMQSIPVRVGIRSRK